MTKFERGVLVINESTMSCCGRPLWDCFCSVGLTMNAVDLAEMAGQRHSFDQPAQGPGRSPAPRPAPRGKPQQDAPGRGFDRDVLPLPAMQFERGGKDRSAGALLDRLEGNDDEAENEEDDELASHPDRLALPETIDRIAKSRGREIARNNRQPGRVVRPRAGRDVLIPPSIDWTA
jgi:hypothetical protein